MLDIIYGEQRETVCEVSADSSAFVSCLLTLANTAIGKRPYVPGLSERGRRCQLIIAGVYANGVGVSREIVSLPAPGVIRIYDMDSGESGTQLGEVSMTLSLEDATVKVTQSLIIGGVEFELKSEEFIDAAGGGSVLNSIVLRQVSSPLTSPGVRLEYGVDDTAANEYLGAYPWISSKYYEINGCKGEDEDEDGNFSIVVNTAEVRLNYVGSIQRSSLISSSVCSWRKERGGFMTSVSLDFSKNLSHQLLIRWQPKSERELKMVSQPGFSDVKAAHRMRWSKHWDEHGVDIKAGGASVELGIKYAVFQLLQHGVGPACKKSGTLSPARGLTSTYHSGATFFDTELHKFMFWVWNEPSRARDFIDYRYSSLQSAIDFAKATQFAGARFPEASNDLGKENGPHYVLSYPNPGFKKEWSVEEVLHISADVCYAIFKYWVVTGDESYLRSKGCKIIYECAQFAVSALKWSDKKRAYVVERVMGPDEYHYHVDNSFFTNYMLRWCIKFALSLVDRHFLTGVSVDLLAYWKEVSDNVYMPWMDVGGVLIPEEFDGYSLLPDVKPRVHNSAGPNFGDALEREAADGLHNFKSKLIKQADVILLMSMFPDDFSTEVKIAAFSFYEPLTVHESSLSYGPHAVVAAHIGDKEDSAKFITKASRYNLDFTPVTDYSNGLHLSAYAGAWQGLVEGLAGLRVDDNQLSFQPQLPCNWSSYQFSIAFRGRRFKLTVEEDGRMDVLCEDSIIKTELRSNGRIYLRRLGGHT